MNTRYARIPLAAHNDKGAGKALRRPFANAPIARDESTGNGRRPCSRSSRADATRLGTISDFNFRTTHFVAFIQYFAASCSSVVEDIPLVIQPSGAKNMDPGTKRVLKQELIRAALLSATQNGSSAGKKSPEKKSPGGCLNLLLISLMAIGGIVVLLIIIAIVSAASGS